MWSLKNLVFKNRVWFGVTPPPVWQITRLFTWFFLWNLPNTLWSKILKQTRSIKSSIWISRSAIENWALICAGNGRHHLVRASLWSALHQFVALLASHWQFLFFKGNTYYFQCFLQSAIALPSLVITFCTGFCRILGSLVPRILPSQD